MNVFTMMSDSYKQLLNEGKVTKEEAEKEIRINDFLAECDSDDFCRIIDSGAFNSIIRAYLEFIINNAELDDKTKGKITSQLSWVFDEMSAEKVLNAVK